MKISSNSDQDSRSGGDARDKPGHDDADAVAYEGIAKSPANRGTPRPAEANVALALLVVALIVIGLVFGLWPELDLAVTRYVYQHGGFWGVSEATRNARDFLRLAPDWLLGGLAVFWFARRLRWTTFGPSDRAMIFLAASLVIGSGLIVNLGLKDHAHRPRPVHVSEFGGETAFRPWYTFDGACKKNCSFASGEAASGFWMLAPALMAPPPWKAVAVVAAIVYGVVTSALRVAFGGHFLSDVLFGGLISAIIVVGLWRLLFPERRPR